MALGKSKLKKKHLKGQKLRDVSSPGQLAAQMDRVRRLEAQLDTLLQKLDADTGVTDTDYETTVESIE